MERHEIMKKRPAGRPKIHKNNAARCRAYRRRRKQSRQLVYWRSTTDLWSTPPDLFAALDAEFHFTTDVCAVPENAQCPHYYTPEQDGLRQVWTGACYANPPYGLVLRQWVRKAYESAQAGATVVCLLPVRTDTVWWQDYVIPYAEVCFLPKRLKFGGTPHNAPFPCAVVIFRSNQADARQPHD